VIESYVVASAMAEFLGVLCTDAGAELEGSWSRSASAPDRLGSLKRTLMLSIANLA
jgi:hypothetical protein